MHLKNFSLLRGEDEIVRLTPAYDVVSTHPVIPGDPLALPVGGKRTHLAGGDFLHLADYCGPPRTVAERMLRTQEAVTEEAATLGISFSLGGLANMGTDLTYIHGFTDVATNSVADFKNRAFTLPAHLGFEVLEACHG